MRLMSDHEICMNYKYTLGQSATRIKRIQEMNPDLTKQDIVGILQRNGIAVTQRRKVIKAPNTSREEREEIRRQDAERLKQSVTVRETQKAWAERLGMSLSVLRKILNTSEEDWM